MFAGGAATTARASLLDSLLVFVGRLKSQPAHLTSSSHLECKGHRLSLKPASKHAPEKALRFRL